MTWKQFYTDFWKRMEPGFAVRPDVTRELELRSSRWAGKIGLELGVGMGFYSKTLATKCRTLYLNDINEHHLEHALSIEFERDNVKSLPGDASSLSVPDEIDVIFYLGNGLPHLSLSQFIKMAMNLSSRKDRLIVIEYMDFLETIRSDGFREKTYEPTGDADVMIESDFSKGIVAKSFSSQGSTYNISWNIYSSFIVQGVMESAGFKFDDRFSKVYSRNATVTRLDFFCN